SPRVQGAGRSFACFARAEHQDTSAAQVPENFARQFHRDRADRDRAACDLRVAPDMLRNAKCPLEKTMQYWSRAAGFPRRRVGFFHLSENFRLADDHRVQTRHDSKEMLRASLAIVAIKGTGVLHFTGPLE